VNAAPVVPGSLAEATATVPARPVRDAGRVLVDLRLVVPAVLAWSAAVVVTRVRPATALGVAGVALALACLALAAPHGIGRRGAGRRRLVAGTLARRTPARRTVARGAVALGTVALGLVAAAAVLLSGSAQRQAVDHGLLPQAARDGATVRLTGVVTGDPRTLPPAWPGAPARAAVVLAGSGVTSHGRTGRAAGDVLVVGPGAWASVPYRARVSVTGRAQAGGAGERTVAVVTTNAAPEVVGAPPRWAALTSAVRGRVTTLAADQPGDAGALLAGITVGDTGRMPADLVGALRSAGLTHVTAVSGAHFALVVALVLSLASTVRAPRRVRAASALLATGATVALVHPDPSVLRAAVMGLVGVVGLLAGRPARAPASLCTAVVVLVTIDPWLGLQLGFVLSVLATAGLVLAGAPLARRWAARVGRGPAEALALPLAAQLACAPVLLLVQPDVSTYAVPANAAAAPAVGPATVLGLLAGVVDPLCHPLAEALAACAAAACWWVAAVARVAASAPGAHLAWLPGPVGVAVLALASVCVVLLLLRTRREA
jgi:competence protein ComEC